MASLKAFSSSDLIVVITSSSSSDKDLLDKNLQKVESRKISETEI